MSTWDQSFDFVSVGSGGGGLCAALTAQVGGASALVIEKRAIIGGSTAMSGGILWIPANDLMRDEGLGDSTEEALRYFESAVGDVGPASSIERRKAYIAGGNEMIRFLGDLGIPWLRSPGYSDYHDHLDGGRGEGRGLIVKTFNLKELGPWSKRFPKRRGRGRLAASSNDASALNLMVRTWDGFRTTSRVLACTIGGYAIGREPVGAGAAVIGRMLQLCLKAGVKVELETALQELVVEDGRVVGLIAKQKGRTIRIQARKGVMIGAGGYARNLDMRNTAGPSPASVSWTSTNDGDTGEAILAARAAGAATSNMDDAWWVPSTVMPNGKPAFFIGERSKPNCIMVDSSAQRYVDEAASYMYVGQKMYERNKEVPSIPSWFIMDARHRRRYLWGSTPPGYVPRSWLKSGYFLKANSIAELARLCKLDPAALTATVERFNGFARAGVDEDFHKGHNFYDRFYGDPRQKPNPCLGEISKGPFYAVKVYPGDAGTSGGILTDADGRALDEHGEPIPGLYATGNSTASVAGHTYVGPGITIGASFIYGYLSARHAVGSDEPGADEPGGVETGLATTSSAVRRAR